MDFGALKHNQLMVFLAEHPQDESAWREYFSRFDHFVHCKIKQLCGQRHVGPSNEIEDLAWEVHEKVLRHLRQYVGQFENSIFDYLAMIAANTVKNHFRHENAASRPPRKKGISIDKPIHSEHDSTARTFAETLAAAPQDEDPSNWELRETIETCLRMILKSGRHSRRDRFIAVMRFILDMSVEEIAGHAQINLSPQSVHRIVHEIKPKLQHCLNTELHA